MKQNIQECKVLFLKKCLMDIRIKVDFKFEEGVYPADILIIKLSVSPPRFFCVVHIFDDQLVSQFSRRYILITNHKEFIPIETKTQRENMLVHSIQNEIMNHRHNPWLGNHAYSIIIPDN